MAIAFAPHVVSANWSYPDNPTKEKPADQTSHLTGVRKQQPTVTSYPPSKKKQKKEASQSPKSADLSSRNKTNVTPPSQSTDLETLIPQQEATKNKLDKYIKVTQSLSLEKTPKVVWDKIESLQSKLTTIQKEIEKIKSENGS